VAEDFEVGHPFALQHPLAGGPAGFEHEHPAAFGGETLEPWTRCPRADLLVAVECHANGKIIGKTGFKQLFPKGIESNQLLTRPPKGYELENPALDYLKMKNYFISKPFTDKEALSKGFEKEVAKHYKMMKPVIDFMNRSLE